MNILLLPKKFTHLALALLLCLLALPGFSQDFQELTVLKNSSVSFSFDNYSSISLNAASVQEQATNGYVVFNPPYTKTNGNGTVTVDDQKGPFGTYPTVNTIVYTPDTDYLGEDVFTIRYRKKVGNSTATWATKVFHVSVVPSAITANNDYRTLENGENSITIDVLINDYSNGTGLEVRTVPVTNNGTTQLIDNNTKIVFTPEPGFKGIADFNYVICDEQGACDGAIVNICVLGTGGNYEKLEIFTKEDTPQVVIAALEGFAVTTAPQNGVVTDTSGVWVYHPNQDFDGTDSFILTGNGNTQEVEIRVLNAPKPNTFLRPDTYYVAVDGEAVFFPLENDIASDYYNDAFTGIAQQPAHGEAFYDSNSNSFGYVPEEGFSGIDEFKYRARGPGSYYSETETVRIVVSNQVPAAVYYQFSTPIGTPMVIAYNIPIKDYTYIDYTGNSDLQHGTLEFHPGETTLTINGQEVSGYNMLVYTPTGNSVEEEDFEYRYCAGGGFTDCHLVKIHVDIEENNAPVDDFCVGPDCVWTGDANHDGVVDIRDLLPIGWCMGEVGVARPVPDANWYGQHADDWNTPMGERINLKHVDVDGDGIVEAMDTIGISAHYGLHHSPTPNVEGLLISDDKLGWGDGNPMTVQPGDVILVPFYYGNEENPVLDGYGFTFELPYEPAFFEDVNIHYDDESWMSYNSPILTMNKDAAPGVLHSGYSRTSGLSASGFGTIGQVEFIVVDDLLGIRPKSNQIQVSFNPMGEMNGAGQTSTSNSSSLTFILDLDGDETNTETINPDQLKVYPNPTKEQLNVHLNGLGNEVERVVVYTITGQEVHNSGAIQAKRVELNVANYATGIYVLKAFTNGGVITKKFEVID